MVESVLAHLGLGANLPPAQRSLERAVAALAGLPGAAIEGVSRLYRTRPVGPVDQPDFLNAVVALRLPLHGHPDVAAMSLLGELKRIERMLGRQERERWGPREVDIDLLLFGDHVIRVRRSPTARSADPARAEEQWLEVPHPEAPRRLFVLAPLADLAPDLCPPGWAMTVAAAGRARRLEAPGAAQVVGEWDAGAGRWIPAAVGEARPLT
jgi:2-amino-4-hydroxy-6-hydroxymethyldihydropteridine diphosphokinase